VVVCIRAKFAQKLLVTPVTTRRSSGLQSCTAVTNPGGSFVGFARTPPLTSHHRIKLPITVLLSSGLHHYGRPICNRADHYIFILWFLLSFFFLSSPNLSGRRLDVCHTSTHGVALVRIYDAGLKRAARGSLEMRDAKKSPKGRHLRTIAQLCQAITSQLRHVSTTRKKLVKQQYLLHMSPQYGELRPTSG